MGRSATQKCQVVALSHPWSGSSSLLLCALFAAWLYTSERSRDGVRLNTSHRE